MLKKEHALNSLETGQVICSVNQLNGFYMMATSVFNELRKIAQRRI